MAEEKPLRKKYQKSVSFDQSRLVVETKNEEEKKDPSETNLDQSASKKKSKKGKVDPQLTKFLKEWDELDADLSKKRIQKSVSIKERRTPPSEDKKSDSPKNIVKEKSKESPKQEKPTAETKQEQPKKSEEKKETVSPPKDLPKKKEISPKQEKKSSRKSF